MNTMNKTRKQWLWSALLSALVAVLWVVPVEADDCRRAQELTVAAGKQLERNPALAEEMLQEALGLCEESASIRYNLAVVMMMRGKYGEATVYLREAIRKRPDYARAYHAMALVAIKQGDQSSAVENARKAVSLEPDNPEFQGTLLSSMDVDTPTVTSARQPDAVAVVIGNRNYQDPILAKAPVEYALNDAQVVREYLVKTLGFSEKNIIFIENATLSDFLKVFGDKRDHKGQLYARIRPGASTVFVFYSGHGAPDTDTRKAFLVPSDADPTVVKFTGYSLETLNENLGKIASEKGVGRVILAMDSCFSGGYNNGMIIPGASPIFMEAKAAAPAERNTVVISSSRNDQVSSWYPEKKHGLFTYFFLKGIKESAESGRAVTVGDMEKYLLASDAVGDMARQLYNREQVPQVQGDRSLMIYQP